MFHHLQTDISDIVAGFCLWFTVWDFRDPIEGYQIFVKTLTGQTVTFDVFPTTTIKELKLKIIETEQLYGICTKSMRLIHGGKSLAENHNLDTYHIEQESTIHLVLSLGGS
jgi:ubiquitin C